MKRKRSIQLPPLSNRKGKTPPIFVPTAGRAPTAKERQACWNAYANAEKEITCPGCFTTKLYYTKKSGWEASHIRARSLGGEPHPYNLFPLCKNCNKTMDNGNMFCHFYRPDDLSASLKELICCMHTVFRIEYARVYERLQGQFTRLARFYYKEKQSGDGGIPSSHLIWKQFLQYDIRLNNRRVAELQKELDEARAVALEVSREYVI